MIWLMVGRFINNNKDEILEKVDLENEFEADYHASSMQYTWGDRWRIWPVKKENYCV